MITNSKYKEVAIDCLKVEAEALIGLIPNIDEDFDKAVELIIECSGKVIVTGVGKSGHIGAKIAATLSSTGTPSFFVNPLDVFHGDLGVITTSDVVLAISNSGQTDELLRFLPYLTERSIPVIGMTGNPNSLLAKNATVHLNAAVHREACPLGLAPTASTTATLALGDALACALMEARDFQESDFAQFHPGGTLGKRLLTKAVDVMYTEDLPVISGKMKLSEAVIHMSRGRLGLCVIVERRAMERNQSTFFELTAENIMTPKPKTISPNTRIAEIDKILHKNKIHAVIVTDNEQHVLGIVDSFSTQL